MNKSLINEKKYFLKCLKNNRKKYLTNIFSKVTKKIAHIYKQISLLNEKIFLIENNCKNKNCNNLDMLKFIENFVNCLLLNIKKLKEKNILNNIIINEEIKRNIKNFKEKTIKEKKEKKNREKKYFNFLKKKFNKNEEDKIYFIPNKKVNWDYAFNMKKLMKKNKSNKNFNNINNNNNNNLLNSNIKKTKSNKSFNNKNTINYYKEFSLYDL